MRFSIFSLMLLLATACNIDEKETLPPAVSADFTTLLEYTPAPGQFINDTALAGFTGEATPETAAAYAERRLRNRDFVSLGSWGGYLVAGFAETVQNDGDYNLLIEGNQMSSSSEPGVVWVMRDENGNEKPDDTWYELRGSEAENSIRNYEVTYRRPTADTDPVAWSDNRGGSGTIDRTVEHPQSYFPAWISGDSYTLRGTRLPDNVVFEDNLWIAKSFTWGYVDNYGSVGRNLFRISDAVDADGNSVSLPSINFVKIQSSILAQAPLIGEISTEVCGIRNYNLIK